MKKSKIKSIFNIQHLKQLTHWNRHTKARLYLSKKIGDEYFINIYEGIDKIQETERGLPRDLAKYRDEIDEKLMEAIHQRYPEHFKAIIKAM